jgi:hypothetical protein
LNRQGCGQLTRLGDLLRPEASSSQRVPARRSGASYQDTGWFAVARVAERFKSDGSTHPMNLTQINVSKVKFENDS